MSIGFQWQDDGSVIVTCGKDALHIRRSPPDNTGSPPGDSASPPANPPPASPPKPPSPPPSGPFRISSKPTSSPLAVEIKLGDEFHGTYTLDVFKGMQRIAKASELSGLITEHMAEVGQGASTPAFMNLEWASDEPVLVHDLTKRLHNQFAGPMSIQLMPGKKTP